MHRCLYDGLMLKGKNLFCASRKSAWRWRVEGGMFLEGMDLETLLTTANPCMT